MRNKLKILAKIGMVANAKYNAGCHLQTLRQKTRSAQQNFLWISGIADYYPL